MPRTARPARGDERRPREPAPPARSSGPWGAWFAVAVALLAGSIWLVLATGRLGRLGFAMDDPYIHLQFARNLAHGQGFSFNPGEPVPGATSPLWVFVLALPQLLAIPAEPTAAALGLVSAALAAALTFTAGRACALPGSLAGLAALATALTARFTWASVSGMETCLAAALSLALMLVSLSSWTGFRRGATLGLLAGVAANTRPELLLLGLLVGVFEMLPAAGRPGSPPPGDGARVARASVLAGFVLVFVATVLPYVGFCLATTGRPLPNTFYAKSLIPLAATDLDLGGLRRSYLLEMLQWALDDNLVLGLLLLPGLVLWARRPGPRRSWIVLLWPLAFWAYSLILVPRHFSLSRYTIPLIPFLALIGVSPIEALLRRTSAGAGRVWVGVAAALVVIAGIAGQARLQPVYVAQVANILRMQVAMGEWVAANLPRDARIATNDVGAVTWYGRRYCIDTVGLVDSRLIARELRARRAGRVDVERALVEHLAERGPNYCILFPSWYPRLVQAPWLRPVHVIRYPNVTGGDDEFVVFAVAGPPAPLRP